MCHIYVTITSVEKHDTHSCRFPLLCLNATFPLSGTVQVRLVRHSLKRLTLRCVQDRSISYINNEVFQAQHVSRKNVDACKRLVVQSFSAA